MSPPACQHLRAAAAFDCACRASAPLHDSLWFCALASFPACACRHGLPIPVTVRVPLCMCMGSYFIDSFSAGQPKAGEQAGERGKGSKRPKTPPTSQLSPGQKLDLLLGTTPVSAK